MLQQVLVALILTTLCTGILQSAHRPFELVLAVHEGSKCSVVAVRHTQHHKGLSSNEPRHYVVEKSRKPARGLDEQLHIFAFHQEVLWARLGALSICNDILWDKSVPLGPNEISTEAPQRVLSSIPVDGVDWKAHVPPLHIERLIESGPSNNRVDLVFFADGCTYISLACVIFNPTVFDI
jgi:hypothetical protein